MGVAVEGLGQLVAHARGLAQQFGVVARHHLHGQRLVQIGADAGKRDARHQREGQCELDSQ
ncbi:hypothetical protein D3C72_1980440 [compost metagenome]